MEKPRAKVEVVAGVLLEKDNKFLLVQEGRGPKRGLWNWPAGKVDEGDSIEKTAVKEALEESGLSVKLVKELGIWHENMEVPVKHLFYAEIVGGELMKPNEEIMDLRWVTLGEIEKMEGLRSSWILEGVRLFNNGR